MSKQEFIDIMYDVEDMMLWIRVMEGHDIEVLDANPIYRLIDRSVELLQKIMKDEVGFISWYCFDLDFGHNDNGVIWVGDKEYIIQTTEDLYNYLTMEENK